jgi:hypothetical protein
MDGDDEAEILRIQDDDWTVDQQRRQPMAEAASLTIVGAITAGGGSYATNTFYTVQPYTITGPQGSGEEATFTPYGATIQALNLGIEAPPTGTFVIITFVPNRWVFRYDG